MSTFELCRPLGVTWLGYGGLLQFVALALPGWYLPLRLQLSGVASLCLGTAHFFASVPGSQGSTA
jgi:hypothetical protein